LKSNPLEIFLFSSSQRLSGSVFYRIFRLFPEVNHEWIFSVLSKSFYSISIQPARKYMLVYFYNIISGVSFGRNFEILGNLVFSEVSKKPQKLRKDSAYNMAQIIFNSRLVVLAQDSTDPYN